jgi:hypothetical protein
MLPVPGREAEWKKDSPRKTLWVTEMLAWARLEGQMLSKLKLSEKRLNELDAALAVAVGIS